VRQRVPNPIVLWAGYLLAGGVLAWLVTGSRPLGMGCAVLGGLYSLLSIAFPGSMPRLEVEGLPRPPEGVVRWSHRLLGVAGIPLWIAAWRGDAPHLPSGLLMPIGVGVAVAVAAELLADRRQGRRS
jgi:hypothetical protein